MGRVPHDLIPTMSLVLAVSGWDSRAPQFPSGPCGEAPNVWKRMLLGRWSQLT
jgi:hypothetical protein